MAHHVVSAHKKHGGKSGGKKHGGISRAQEVTYRRTPNGFISRTTPEHDPMGPYQSGVEDVHHNLAALHDHMDNTLGEGGQDVSEPTTDANNNGDVA